MEHKIVQAAQEIKVAAEASALELLWLKSRDGLAVEVPAVVLKMVKLQLPEFEEEINQNNPLIVPFNNAELVDFNAISLLLAQTADAKRIEEAFAALGAEKLLKVAAVANYLGVDELVETIFKNVIRIAAHDPKFMQQLVADVAAGKSSVMARFATLLRKYMPTVLWLEKPLVLSQEEIDKIKLAQTELWKITSDGVLSSEGIEGQDYFSFERGKGSRYPIASVGWNHDGSEFACFAMGGKIIFFKKLPGAQCFSISKELEIPGADKIPPTSPSYLFRGALQFVDNNILQIKVWNVNDLRAIKIRDVSETAREYIGLLLDGAGLEKLTFEQLLLLAILGSAKDNKGFAQALATYTSVPGIQKYVALGFGVAGDSGAGAEESKKKSEI